MRGAKGIFFMAACSAPAAPPVQPIANHVAIPVDAAAAEPLEACGPSTLATIERKPHRMIGAVCEKTSRAWLSGVTVNVSGASGEKFATTKPDGTWWVDNLPDGAYHVVYYYADSYLETKISMPAKPFTQAYDEHGGRP